MDKNKLTAIINKPVAEVFEFCIIPPKATLWVPDIVDETSSDWLVKAGTIESPIALIV